MKDIVGNSRGGGGGGGLSIKSDGDQNIKGTKVSQMLYPRVH